MTKHCRTLGKGYISYDISEFQLKISSDNKHPYKYFILTTNECLKDHRFRYFIVCTNVSTKNLLSKINIFLV